MKSVSFGFGCYDVDGGNVFASPDANPAEALESARKTRDAIDQGKPMVMDSEGTLRAKDDKNSLNKTNISEVKGGNEFASPDANSAEALESIRKTRDAIDQEKPMVMNPEGTLRAKDDENSLNKTNISEIMGGNYFSSPDVNPAEALESARKTRDAIDQGKPMVMDSEGTLRAKDDKNSLNKTNISEVKGGNEFASQWYKTNIELYKFEYNEMMRCFPHAKMSMLPDDRLCWDITFPGIVDLDGNKHSWTFKFIYDSDHPHDKGWGGGQ